MLREGGHILVVDDQKINRLKLSVSLQKQGHTVALAEGGLQALEMLRAEPFDLVLLDLLMPDMDGYQVLEQMKQDSLLRDIPVIVVSAVNEMESIIKGIELGAEDYLPKTFEPVLLKTRVGNCLEKKRLRDHHKAYLRQSSHEDQAITSPAEFYDRMTPFYHLIFADWEASTQRQATQLDALIREKWGAEVTTILDVACGIGTQSLGLAQLGYHVTASDLSSAEIERARQEAATRQLPISFSVADMRQVHDHHQQQFDLVIACDNAIPHLLTDAEILQAFRQFYACTRPGGGCLITVRDYDQEERSGTQVKPYGLRQEGDTRYLIFQVWQFQNPPLYELAMYFIEDHGHPTAPTHIMRTRYYAISITRLMALMTEAGFREIEKIEGVFYQPVIVGKRPLP